MPPQGSEHWHLSTSSTFYILVGIHFSLLHQPDPFMNVASRTSQVLSDYIYSSSHLPLLWFVVPFLHVRNLLCPGSTRKPSHLSHQCASSITSSPQWILCSGVHVWSVRRHKALGCSYVFFYSPNLVNSLRLALAIHSRLRQLRHT